mgnify:CR=1 FL=1
MSLKHQAQHQETTTTSLEEARVIGGGNENWIIQSDLGTFNAKKAGIDPAVFVSASKSLATKEKHIAIAKSLNRKNLINKINSAISKLKRNGTISKIISSYEN